MRLPSRPSFHSRTINQSRVIKPTFETASEFHFGILGEVSKPGCYEWNSPNPVASDLIQKAGGQNQQSGGSVLIIRAGRPGLRLMPIALAQYSLRSGDLLVVEKKQVTSNRIRLSTSRVQNFPVGQPIPLKKEAPKVDDGDVSIGLINVIGRPAVVTISKEDATLSKIVQQIMGQSETIVSQVKVITPLPRRKLNLIGAERQLVSGTVLIFKKGTVDLSRVPELPRPLKETPQSVSRWFEKTEISTEFPRAITQKEDRAISALPTPVLALPKLKSSPEANVAESVPASQLTVKEQLIAKEQSALILPDLQKFERSVPSAIPLLAEPQANLEEVPAPVLEPLLEQRASAEDSKFNTKTTNATKFTRTAMTQAVPFPFPEDGSSNISRESLPPLPEEEKSTTKIPAPLDIPNPPENSQLSDLSLVGIISGVGILVAVMSVLISALWSEMDDHSGLEQGVATIDSVVTQSSVNQSMEETKVMSAPLEAARSSLQTLIDNNLPIVEEIVVPPADVEFFGVAKPSRSYRVDTAHVRNDPSGESTISAPHIPAPHIGRKPKKKPQANDTQQGGTITQLPEPPAQSSISELQEIAQNWEEPGVVKDDEEKIISEMNSETYSLQPTDENKNQTPDMKIERLDSAEEPKKRTKKPSGLLDRALEAMKQEKKQS